MFKLFFSNSFAYWFFIDQYSEYISMWDSKESITFIHEVVHKPLIKNAVWRDDIVYDCLVVQCFVFPENVMSFQQQKLFWLGSFFHFSFDKSPVFNKMHPSIKKRKRKHFFLKNIYFISKKEVVLIIIDIFPFVGQHCDLMTAMWKLT